MSEETAGRISRRKKEGERRVKHVVRELSEVPVPNNPTAGTEDEISEYLSVFLDDGWVLQHAFFLGMFDKRVRMLYVLVKV